MSCLQCCTGALLTCPFGVAPGAFDSLLPSKKTMTETPAGNIEDVTPFVDIPSFGLCTSLGNPITLALTIAASIAAMSFVFVPGPCIPSLASWLPTAPTVFVGALPTFTMESTASCTSGGSVSVSFAGQAVVFIKT